MDKPPKTRTKKAKRAPDKSALASRLALLRVDASEVNRMSQSISDKLADFHFYGSVRKDRETGQVEIAHTGTGVALTSDDKTELFLSARCALVEYVNAGNALDFSAWKHGANVARKSLYQIERSAKQRAGDVAEMEKQESEHPNSMQARYSDCLFAPNESRSISERRVVLLGYLSAKRALARHWQSKQYPRARSDARRDFATLRSATRLLLNGGTYQSAKRENEAAYQRNLDLARRVNSGRELLAQDRDAKQFASLLAGAKLALWETQAIGEQRAGGTLKTLAALPTPNESELVECELVTLPESPAIVREVQRRKQGVRRSITQPSARIACIMATL